MEISFVEIIENVFSRDLPKKSYFSFSFRVMGDKEPPDILNIASRTNTGISYT